jgi:hypothetical protein
MSLNWFRVTVWRDPSSSLVWFGATIRNNSGGVEWVDDEIFVGSVWVQCSSQTIGRLTREATIR